MIYWTTDSRDTGDWSASIPSAQSLACRLKDGGVLLAHDFDRKSQERFRYVLEVLETALNVSRDHNLRLDTPVKRKAE